ncbi:MAG: hypothetical protein JWM52_565 [Candidatus Saccharibacteria bacterium]|nr:hypothetical protein [Candidatus Saccharibacteria bacterium]
MKKSTKVLILVLSTIVGLTVFLTGLFQLYQTGKTDEAGSGTITVAQCKEADWAWRIYDCTGSYFSTSGGMVEINDVTVRVTGGEYKKDDYIGDVYPTDAPSVFNTHPHHFITGRIRSSVLYNAPSIIMSFIGLLLPIGTALYLLGASSETKKKTKQ